VTHRDAIIAPGDGHTRKLCLQWPNRHREYFRGPTVDGFKTRQIAEKAAESARKLRGLQGVTGLFMFGHSRGGAAIIHAAGILQEQNILIEFMGLFDAVQMTNTVDAAVVPANVLRVRHARRDPISRSRPGWGNCGTRTAAVIPIYDERFFVCTHGAVGGTPYPKEYEDHQGFIHEAGEHLSTKVTARDDERGSKRVWEYMKEEIERAKLWYESPRDGKSGNGKPGNGKPGNEVTHTVESGESLSLIAGKYWEDALLWPILYDHNKSVVGSNHNLIKPPQKLIIPDIRRYTAPQLNDARARGRNWR
jgi:nucleoid-associated protein YgaU